MASAYEDVIRRIYKEMGFQIDKEILDIFLSDAQHKIICAPAGGTKTTLVQVEVSKLKSQRVVQAIIANRAIENSMSTSFNKENIFCCVYNKHNTASINAIHKKVYRVVENLGLVSSDVDSPRYSDDGVLAETLHGFARSLLNTNKKYFKLKEVAPSKDTILDAQLRSCVKKVLGSEPASLAPYSELYQLYTNLMLYETLDLDDVQFQDALLSNEMTDKGLLDIFTMYDNNKRIFKMQDYSDWLKMADQLLKIPEIADRIHKRFKIIVADEIQDFTRLMFSVYSKLVSDKSKTIAIGDPDQTIYAYNGASPENINKYEELTGLKNVARFNLIHNRRSMANTFHFAKNVLGEIEGRNPINIVPVKSGGRYATLTYHTYQEEVEAIEQELRDVKYGTTVIQFRKKKTPLLLSRHLYKCGIGVNYINATPFNQHQMYNMFQSMIKSVFNERTRDTWKNLYQILPFTKDRLKAFFAFDEKEMPTTFEEVQDWSYLDFSPLIKGNLLKDGGYPQVVFAQGVASKISQLATKNYMELLIEMFYLNYYQFVADKDDVYVQEVKNWLVEDFTSLNTLTKVLSLRAQKDNLISFRMTHPVTISTMHGTKGLEFDRVILAHMETDPAEPKAPNAKIAQYRLENEARLYYVGATRQKACLVLSYNVDRPHIFNAERIMKAPLAIEVEEVFSEVSQSQASAIFSQQNTTLPVRRRFKLGEQ